MTAHSSSDASWVDAHTHSAFNFGKKQVFPLGASYYRAYGMRKKFNVLSLEFRAAFDKFFIEKCPEGP